jgi:hypothetical protein
MSLSILIEGVKSAGIIDAALHPATTVPNRYAYNYGAIFTG